MEGLKKTREKSSVIETENSLDTETDGQMNSVGSRVSTMLNFDTAVTF
jgi:hypothetical protein